MMDIPSAYRVPVELWIDIAVILRHISPCQHGHDMSIRGKSCWKPRCIRNVLARPRALSETSRFLNQALTHILYESLSIDGGYPQATAALISALNQNQDLILGVHTLSITFLEGNLRPIPVSEGFDPITDKLDEITKELHSLLPSFTRIRSLSILCSIITPEIAQLLANAVELRYLGVRSTRWHDDVPHDWSGGDFGHQLQELTLEEDNRHKKGCEQEPPRWLQLFTPGLLRIKCPIFMLNALVPALNSETLSLHKLVKLSLTRSGPFQSEDYVCQLLENCPSLEELDVEDTMTPPTTYRIRHDSLPQLRHVNAFPKLLNSLPPLENLRTVIVRGCTGLPFTSVDDFAIVAPMLHSLVIQNLIWKQRIIGAIANQYPQITHLEINFPKNADITMTLSDIGRLPLLQYLCLRDLDVKDNDVWAKAEENKKNLTDIKANYCLDLTSACFGNLNLQGKWTYDPASGWTLQMDEFL